MCMLCFWLPTSADAQRGRFAVTIHRASGVPTDKDWGLSDTYVVLFFMGEECGRTSIVDDTASPIWEETLICYTCRGHADEPFLLRVYDYNPFDYDDDNLGGVEVASLSTLSVRIHGYPVPRTLC